MNTEQRLFYHVFSVTGVIGIDALYKVAETVEVDQMNTYKSYQNFFVYKEFNVFFGNHRSLLCMNLACISKHTNPTEQHALIKKYCRVKKYHSYLYNNVQGRLNSGNSTSEIIGEHLNEIVF